LGPALPRLIIAIVREVARAEVVILRLPGMISLLAGLVCRVLRRRYCVEVVGDPVAVLASGSLGRLGRVLAPLAGRKMRWVVRHACGALYVTESTLQRRYPPRRDAAVVSVSGVRLGEKAFLDNGRQWRPGPVRIVTVGSQELPYKGHDVLLRAVQRLRSDGVALSAVVVGGGRLHQHLVDLAARLGVSDVVTFTGAVHDRERLLNLLDSASLFVLPSRTEGLPRALLEAMARGLPAVGCDVGGIPELLEKRFLVPVGESDALADTIATLTGDRVEWEAQSRRNLQVARRFRSDVLDARFIQWLGALPDAHVGADR
jgi:glycosyltransferase involved in cell wall biosynthesis